MKLKLTQSEDFNLPRASIVCIAAREIPECLKVPYKSDWCGVVDSIIGDRNIFAAERRVQRAQTRERGPPTQLFAEAIRPVRATMCDGLGIGKSLEHGVCSIHISRQASQGTATPS